MAVKHALTADGDPLVGASDWNASHTIDDGTLVPAKVAFTASDKVLGRSSSGAGNGEEIAVTAAGRALIDDATASDQRTTLGLGTAATQASTAFANASHSHSAGDVPDLDSLTAPSADVSLNSHKITSLATPTADGDAATKKYVDDSVAAGVSFATPSIVLGSSAAGGAASTTVRSDSTIAAFDATAPTTQALGDSAVVGSAAFAARRDHKHAMPAASSIAGYELDYVAITSDVNVTATTDGTANTLITGTSRSYPNAPIMIEVVSPRLQAPNGASAYCYVSVYEDSTLLGYIGIVRVGGASANNWVPLHGVIRRTPTAATHQYIVKGVVSTGTGVFGAGAGGTDYAPAFLRITLA